MKMVSDCANDNFNLVKSNVGDDLHHSSHTFPSITTDSLGLHFLLSCLIQHFQLAVRFFNPSQTSSKLAKMPPKKQPEKDQKDKDKPPGNLPAIPTPRSTRSAAPSPSSLNSTPTPNTPSRRRPPAARAPPATFDMPPPTHFTRSHAYFADQAFGMGGVAMVRSGATVPVRTGTSLGLPPAAAKRVAEIAGGTASPGGWGPVNDFYRKRVWGYWRMIYCRAKSFQVKFRIFLRGRGKSGRKYCPFVE